MKIAYMPHKLNDKEGAIWAEHTMMIKLMKYSKNVEIFPAYDPWKLPPDTDILFIHNLAHTALYRKPWLRGASRLEKILRRPIPAFYNSDIEFLFKVRGRPKIIGGIRGNQGFYKAKKFLKYFDAIHVNNRDLQKKVLEAGARKAWLIPPGVDMAQFKPMIDQRPENFIIGWAGDKNKPMKNAHIIEKLGYPFKMATKENFIPHEKMQDFYNGLTVFVHPSSHEGWGRGIIEAMACGLPIISSDTGASRLLDQKWVIPGNPKKKSWLLKCKKKLKILKQFPSLRYDVGDENRMRVKVCSWEKISQIFEMMCEDIVRT